MPRANSLYTLLTLAFVSAMGIAVFCQENLNGEHWELIRLNGADIGFTRIQERWITTNGERLFESKAETQLRLKRTGQTINQTLKITSRENASGELVDFSTQFGSKLAMLSTRAWAKGNQLELTVESGGTTSTQLLDWSPEYRSPYGVEQSLKGNPLQSGEVRKFQMIVPIYNKVAQVTLEAKNKTLTKLLDEPSPLELQEILCHTKLGEEQTLVSRMWIDDQGTILKTIIEGVNQETQRVSRSRALAAGLGAPLDIGELATVRLTQRATGLDQAESVTYKATVDGENTSRLFAEDAHQTVKGEGGAVVWLTVQRAPRDHKKAEAATQADLAGNALIQTNDGRIVELAAKAVDSTVTDEQAIVRHLTQFVHANMRVRQTTQAVASAAEVAAVMEGDCTEFAVLLAAFCRVKQIPARVAVGLVFVPHLNGFGYHMWTEAWIDGRWNSFDATRADGRIGCGHLKMSSSNLEGASPYESFIPVMQAMGRLKLEVVKQK